MKSRAARASSHHDIEHHHQDESYGETDGAQVGVPARLSFRDEFLYDHVEHGSSCEGQHVGQDGGEQ